MTEALTALASRVFFYRLSEINPKVASSPACEPERPLYISLSSAEGAVPTLSLGMACV